jgi:nucleotide-binding universal stress UspA family protein
MGGGSDRTYRRPRRKEDVMVKKILVGTDTSASADLAVEAAAGLARAHEAELVVLYVKPAVEAREVFDPRKAPHAGGYLRRVEERLRGIPTRTRQEDGDPVEAIIEVAEEENADVIVVGNRGTRGRRREFLSSVPGGLIRRAPTSVLIVDTRVAQ